MGMLVDGEWHDVWYSTKETGGRFQRQDSRFRNWVTADGSAGPTGGGGFRAEPGRYHLYVSLACPWAHRTLIFRALKRLEDAISVSIVHPLMAEHGWTFRAEDGATGDNLYGLDYLHQIYTRADPAYSGRVTVPVLWDKERQTIVSNESSEIIRMFNSAFDAYRRRLPRFLSGRTARRDRRGQRAGLSGGEQRRLPRRLRHHAGSLRGGLRRVVRHARHAGRPAVAAALSRRRPPTEADWRLFTTLVRFDPVYVGHFKCNLRRIADYPNLSNYLRDLYQVPGVAGTVSLDHIKRHYYGSHATINPTGIVPKGPAIDHAAPHDRGRF